MNSKVSGTGNVEEAVKKNIDIFTYKQSLWSIDMKTKVVQQVPRIKLDNLTSGQPDILTT